jgi:hypothetical protein
MAGPQRSGESERTVRPLSVVMAYILAQDVLEVTAAEDEEMVEALTADCSYAPLGDRVRDRCPHRRLDHFHAL